MKLRNKKTGEILETGDNFLHMQGRYLYNSLAELNEEWEDAPEEPKMYWYINEFGTPTKADFVGRETLYDKCRKNFGNHFETEEEAEKAVVKLKAVKRLKDKEFRFTNWEFRDVLNGDLVIEAKLNFDNTSSVQRELEVCFGGEE